MVFQLQDSIWPIIFVLAVVVIVLVVAMMTVLIRNANPMPGMALVLAGLIMVCSVTAVVFAIQSKMENDANFSRQLMDEYHATSNRSLASIQGDFTRLHGSNVVLTRDGKDTPVFVELVTRDDKAITMVFNVLDGSSVYEKTNK